MSEFTITTMPIQTMKVVPLLLACTVCLSLAGSPVIGSEDGNQELIVLQEEGLEIQARQIRQMYPEVRKSLEDALGWKLRRPPRVVLIADQEAFQRLSGSPLISAFAVPRQHSIVMHLSPATSNPYVLRETLEHELCHLVLHAHMSRDVLPRWLDEGVCQRLSGSLGEILAGQGFVTSGISLTRHPIPLQQLAASFPAERQALLQAYEGSRLFVDFLVARHGKEGLLALLERLKTGDDIDEAMRQAFSNSLESLQAEWLQGLKSGNLWLLWVSQYLYEMLFFGGALLTVLAFVRSRMKKRAYDPEEEDEA